MLTRFCHEIDPLKHVCVQQLIHSFILLSELHVFLYGAHFTNHVIQSTCASK